MPGQSRQATEAKVQQVRDTLDSTLRDGGDVTIRGIARAAGVDHVFILRRDDLRGEILAHAPHGMNEDDVRRPQYTATLSDQERDFVDRARGLAPMAAYAREALLEKAARDLGVSLDDIEQLDTARRPAPRRPNRPAAP